jgi:putative peptidoglycan lipid II flippase
VRVLIRRALPSLGQAGLASLQVLVLLMLANRLAGGVIAFQLALSFYYLAIALGATPVALSLLPRLARIHLDGDTVAFRDTLVRGLAMAFLITIPAAVGYLVLAMPLAHAMAFGRMGSTTGFAMVAASVTGLSLAVVGQTAFMILTYACYARKDTRTPLLSMVLQAAICLVLASSALFVKGPAELLVLGLALGLAVVIAALHLGVHVWQSLTVKGTQRLAPSLTRFVVGAAIMAGPAWVVAQAVPQWFGARIGSRLGIAAAVIVGAGVFVAIQSLLRSPEVGWFMGGIAPTLTLPRKRGRETSELAEAVNG